METLLIQARTHGRVLVRAVDEPQGFLFGFHGYGETAEIQMQRLESIPGTEGWTLVAVQALHRFYRGRSEQIVASWMTRQDREAAMTDNIHYVDRVVETVNPTDRTVVYAGFSQGVAMAYRAAVRGRVAAAGVISVCGDVPPELLEDPRSRFPRVLLVRGERDEWYNEARLQADVAALRSRSTEPHTLVHSGGREWTAEVSEAAAAFIIGSITTPF